jgi:hypothetical protein
MSAFVEKLHQMPESNPAHLIAYAGIALLVAWRLYSRFRRLVGRQTMNPTRAWITVAVFPILLAALLSTSIVRPMSAAALVAGAGIGIALGLYGLRVTRFEAGPEGFFYTPNAHLGIALSMLLVGRLGYRLAQAYFLGASGPAPPSEFARSPLTLVLIGTLAAYYVTYAVGLIRWRSRTDA